jgi:cobalt-zinc-cadmium efflux system outer membrane protein
MWNPLARRASACLLLTVCALNASAQFDSPTTGAAIGLPEALARAVARNPDLLAFGYQIEAAEGQLQQAGLAPNPEVGVAVQDVLGSNAYGGIDSAETTVTLGWILERGVRERIVDAARAGVSLREADAEIMRLDTAAETARRFLTCLAYQGRLRNADEAVAQVEQTVRLIGERVAAGSSLAAELARAEADLARAELLQEDYEHELLSAYHRLSAQWGETDPDFASVSGAVRTLPRLEPFDALLARVDDNPNLMRLMSQQRLDEAELQLAQARSRPSWQVSGGLRRFESTDDLALVGSLTVPLPIRNRNQGRIAEARADIARTQAEMTASRVRIETALFVLYQELNHNLQLAGRLTADVIPRLEQALDDTRRAYEVGRYGYSEWRVVQSELLAANNELLEASVDAHRIVIEIERLTGVRVAVPPTTQ